MKNLIKYAKAHTFLVIVFGLIFVGAMVVLGRVATSKKTADTTGSNTHQVSLVAASTFRNSQATVYADGTVESISQADLKSQVSAPVTAIYASVGSTVRAGQTIMVFQNADVRADLDRAKANRKLAVGQNQTGSQSVDAARLSAIDKIKSAYLAADEAIHTDLDPIILNNQARGDKLSDHISDWRLAQDITNTRIALDTTFPAWKKTIDSLSTSGSSNTEVLKALDVSETNVQAVMNLIDKVSAALANASQIANGSYITTIDGWKMTVTGARSSVNATNNALTTAETSLSTAQTSNDIPAQAGIDLADAGIKSLEAQLAKTYVTSPITGKIAALPFRVGELVSPGQLVATVVGSGGLEVKAYASSEDFTKLQQGAAVMIQDTIAGTLVNISPSLNETNKKIELKILISNPATAGLVVGQTVSAAIESSTTTPSVATTNKEESYYLPIQNVKIVPGSASVYTVDENSKIKDNPVILGEIRGDFIEVKSGITDDMKLVTPVYELNPGETVTVR
jgi:RND family efflux transporter MFP subunit